MAIIVEIGDTFASKADPEIMVSVEDVISPGVFLLSDDTTATFDDLVASYEKLNLGGLPKVSISETIEPTSPEETPKTVHLHTSTKTETHNVVQQQTFRQVEPALVVPTARELTEIEQPVSPTEQAFALLNSKKKTLTEIKLSIAVDGLMSAKDIKQFADLYDASKADMIALIEKTLKPNCNKLISQIASSIASSIIMEPICTNDDISSVIGEH